MHVTSDFLYGIIFQIRYDFKLNVTFHHTSHIVDTNSFDVKFSGCEFECESVDRLYNDKKVPYRILSCKGPPNQLYFVADHP